MAAYAQDTRSQLPGQITGVSNIDQTTATQIANFLAAQGDFPRHHSRVTVEGPTTYTGSDPTPGVDIYEVTGSPGQPGYIDLNAHTGTLPSATAIILANNGPDTINVASNVSNSYLFATGSGNDLVDLHKSAGNDTILTGAGNDSIILGDGRDIVYTGTGNDTVVARDGTNQIYGYSSMRSDGGDDTFKIYGGTNVIKTSDGNNHVNAFGGQNTIDLGSGNNDVNLYNAKYSSTSDTDVVRLGSGSDTVSTGLGTGSIYGGSGPDSISIDHGGNWTVNLDKHSGSGFDTVSVSSGTNQIHGGAGFDQFNISGGSNTVTGGSGPDQFNVNTDAAQSLVGGSGHNLFNLNGASGVGTDTIIGGSGYNYTNVNLTSGAVTIDGSASSHNTVDFTQFAKGSENNGHPTIDHATNTATYTFGTGSTALTVTIDNANHTTVKF